MTLRKHVFIAVNLSNARGASKQQIKFESAYKPKGLNNWELPKYYPPRPRQRKGSTKVISNDRGHLLDSKLKLDQNPWGNFRNTFQLPDKLNIEFVKKYNNCLLKKDKWTTFPKDAKTCDSGKSRKVTCSEKCKITKDLLKVHTKRPKKTSKEKQDHFDLDDIPSHESASETPYPIRDFSVEDKYNLDSNVEPDVILNDNYLDNHKCKLKECEELHEHGHTSLMPRNSDLVTSKLQEFNTSDNLNFDTDKDCLDLKDTNKMYAYHSITEKPNERCPSPIVPPYMNFELAKRMHSNNLEHQPLPDCVADLAFRKLQITGANPGLALDIEPIATGVGIKTHNAGPTHCTKMKVYRPRTSGVVPRPINGNITRSYSAVPGEKKMGAMDLAICWDYKPLIEPPRPKHIDGSNDSAGPAVFTHIETPEDDNVNMGRSSGVFANTLGENSFFDKDILRRKTDFVGKKISTDDVLADINVCPTATRSHSISRDDIACRRLDEARFCKQYKSTPDVFTDPEYKALKEKYLGKDCEFQCAPEETGCKRSGFLRKARSKLCHKIAPETNCCSTITCPPKRMICKNAFRVGVPRYNAAGNFISSDSGCCNNSCHSQKVLVVPRPRDPYVKRNYDIDTLVPPFQSYAGGAGEGGYPEHWRLASVYQHAYKPLEYRTKPLLHTVYK